MNLRYLAAKVVNQVTEGRSLSDALEPALKTLHGHQEKAFVQAICYGVCRFYTRLDVVLSLLLQHPMNEKDGDVHALILVGLYQLMEMRVPEHAAVSETVNAVDKLKKPWAKKLMNALLRSYLRQQDEIQAEIAEDQEAFYAHPQWWIDAIKEAYPEEWQTILQANNVHPPFSLRVNQQKISRDEYLEKLSKEDIVATALQESVQGVVLDRPIAVEALPGFLAGEVSVQDGAAQLAASLLDLAPGQRVLDACAAPGGKLTHMLELEPGLAEVVAVEQDKSRISLIKQNLERLELNASCICADARAVSAWWSKKVFDRILLDAPCSASGVIRRHPDIKLLRQPSDIPALAKIQLGLLNALWPLLAKDGIFVYATCSVFEEENAQVIQQFLSEHPDAKEEKIQADWGVPCEFGRQILPGMHDMDGFYYAKLLKL